MCKRVSLFDFGKTDVDELILPLLAVDWSVLFRGNCVDECIQKFYDAIYECFEIYVPKDIVKNSSILGLTENFKTFIITKQRHTNT
jgi:hypothetical protein